MEYMYCFTRKDPMSLYDKLALAISFARLAIETLKFAQKK